MKRLSRMLGKKDMDTKQIIAAIRAGKQYISHDRNRFCVLCLDGNYVDMKAFLRDVHVKEGYFIWCLQRFEATDVEITKALNVCHQKVPAIGAISNKKTFAEIAKSCFSHE